MLDQIAMVAAVVLPLWNVPLIARIIRRRSSNDISRLWAVGVWICFALMFPSALKSPDPVWKMFSIVNMVLFSVVVACTLTYHRRAKQAPPSLDGRATHPLGGCPGGE